MSTLAIDGTFKARWVAGAPEAFWLARAATLDPVTEDGAAALDRLGLRLVIDLREPSERDIPRHSVPVAQMPLYCLPGGPPEAGTLEETYDFLILERGARLAVAVAAIADSDGPVLVHCAAGKDRTGLVVALALLAAGSTEADVLADYSLSAADVGTHRRGHAEQTVARLGLSGQARAAAALRLHLDSPAAALEHALRTLADQGGPEAFLLRSGVTVAQLRLLRARAEGDRDVH